MRQGLQVWVSEQLSQARSSHHHIHSEASRGEEEEGVDPKKLLNLPPHSLEAQAVRANRSLEGRAALTLSDTDHCHGDLALWEMVRSFLTQN